MIAAARGHAEVVGLLVEHEGGMQSNSDTTALMWAARNGHIKCVRMLMEKEGGMKDKDGWTALMSAADNGHADCVQLLVEYESGIQKHDGMAAFMLTRAIRCPMYIYSFLHNKGLMVDNCEWPDPDQIRGVLDPEVLKNDGMTALMWAADKGHIDCVELLAEREGGMQDKNGWTALMYATYSNSLECARLLVEREKDMKTIHERLGFPPGITALDVAKKTGRTRIAFIISGQCPRSLVHWPFQ